MINNMAVVRFPGTREQQLSGVLVNGDSGTSVISSLVRN
jgi:hypothetical protein